MNENYYQRKNCRICLSSNIVKALSLEPTPPGNNFVSRGQLNLKEKTYPLILYFCKDCSHIQLGHVVNPSILYQNDYSYLTSTSPVFVKHFEKYASHVNDIIQLPDRSFIIDIGSNDGTCLSFFKKMGFNVLGVDPAENIANIAKKNGINTIPEFFSSNLARKIKNEYGLADLITSHNACAHIDDLDNILSGIDILLKDNGVFILEVGYFFDVFSNRWFDTIYHEHLDYHTVSPLEKLFSRFNMQIFKVERINPQGGSIRVFIQKQNGNHIIDKSVDKLISLEKDKGIDKLESLIKFEKYIKDVKQDLINIIRRIKSNGKTIAAFGAPTKATTLCYYFEINKEDIDFIIDDNKLKQNLFTPGKHIPVFSQEKLYEQHPDYLLILAWNFAESIMKKHRAYKDKGGKFIIPMPTPIII